MNGKFAVGITVAGLAVLSASTALAGPTPPAYNWTGFYVGGTVGGNWQNVNYGAPSLNGTVTPSSLYGGILGGYNYQFGRNWVVGVETDFGFLNANNTSVISGTSISTKSSWEDFLRVRAGFLVNPHWLVYGTAGVAFTNQTISVLSDSDSFTRTGFVFGGGVETVLRGSWTLRGEYVGTLYGSHTFIGDEPTKLYSGSFRASLITHTSKWDE